MSAQSMVEVPTLRDLWIRALIAAGHHADAKRMQAAEAKRERKRAKRRG